MPELSYRSPKNGRVFNFRDLAGTVFGELTVKSLSEKRNSTGQHYWLCVCSCGVEKECRGTHLTGGKINSCGNRMLHYSEPAEDRFWRHVNKDGPIIRPELGPCWIWTGAINNKGYGNFNINGPRDYAHRFSWVLHNGPIPEGMKILHRCDNPPCVRPEHHFLGTQKENIHDAIKKGRMPRKITMANVECIRLSSESLKILASRFDISQSYVSSIRNGKLWKKL